jgi:hypothetical protein
LNGDAFLACYAGSGIGQKIKAGKSSVPEKYACSDRAVSAPWPVGAAVKGPNGLGLA